MRKLCASLTALRLLTNALFFFADQTFNIVKELTEWQDSAASCLLPLQFFFVLHYSTTTRFACLFLPERPKTDTR